MSPTAKLVGGCALGGGLGLVGLDGAGQKGMVLAEIEALPRFDAAFVIATCAPRSFECKCGDACCQGWRPYPPWKNSIEFIGEFVLESIGKEIANVRLRRMLIEKHFGVKHKYTDISNRTDIHRDTASRYFREIERVLKQHEYPIWVRFDARLEEIGMTSADFH